MMDAAFIIFVKLKLLKLQLYKNKTLEVILCL
jgi:hypothetical protein